MKSGILFGVGVGPGDPELITLKAVRCIQSSELIAVPKSGEGEGVALQIARQAVPGLDDKEILELFMPMTRDKEKLEASHRLATEQILDRLKQGKNVAFLTLGDPSIYSTYTYLHQRVTEAGFPAQMIAGVPSFCAAAARLGISLSEGAQPLHILPASYEGTEEGLDWNGTKILMKTGRSVPKVKALLRERGQLAGAQMIQKCGMKGEQIFSSLEEADEQASYFSIIIVK